MPYRGAIETVLRRCDELRARLAALGAPIEERACATLAAALAWEAELRARTATRELEIADEQAIAPVACVAAEPTHEPLKIKALAPSLAAGVVVAAGVVLLLALDPHEGAQASAPPVKRSYLVAGRIRSAPSPAHVGDRCTVRVDLDHDACDVDVTCPTLERRFHADSCVTPETSIVARDGKTFDLDGDRGTLTLTTEEGVVTIGFDEWR